jgi:hypothetical protein
MILKSPDNNLVQISVVGICRHPKCRRYHRITAKPDLFGQLAFDWQYKHDNCELEHPGSVEFLSPQRFIPRGFDDRVFEDTGVGPQWPTRH